MNASSWNETGSRAVATGIVSGHREVGPQLPPVRNALGTPIGQYSRNLRGQWVDRG